MSSTGPGSLLVFLAFLMLSMLLVGAYFTAYFGLLQAGGEVQKAGEAAIEQAIIYLFQYPTEVTIVNGNPVVKGETRIVIQNVGSKDITFDRILAISPGGSVVADVKVPGNKGLGVRQWQMYRVQDLGLPDRWSNFDTFRSEVARLVLLSERGKTHGSIWGVPPFLEGVLKAMIVVTVTGVATATNTIAMPRPSSPSPQPQTPQQPPPPPQETSQPSLNCTEVLLYRPTPAGERDPLWCPCARQVAPELYEQYIDICVPGVEHVCLTIYVEPCCNEDTKDACLSPGSWSASGGSGCAAFKQSELRKGVTKRVSGSWSASWRLKEGWGYAGWGISSSRGKDISCSGSGGGTRSGSASGSCSATVPPSAFVTITIVFVKGSSTTTTTTTTATTTKSNPSNPSDSGSGSFGSGSSGSPSGSSSSSSSGSSSSSSSSPSSSSSSSGGGGSGSGPGGGGGSGSSGAGGGSSSGGSTGGSSSRGGGGGGFRGPPVYLI
jgi:hypothetical protein